MYMFIYLFICIYIYNNISCRYFNELIFQGFVILIMTSTHPNLSREESEKYFKTSAGNLQAFPSIFDAPTLKLSVIVPAYNEEERCMCL